MKIIFRLVLFFVCIFTSASLVRAAQYVNQDLHYSLNIPSGWEEISQDIVDAQTKTANELTINGTVYYRKGYYFKESKSTEPPYFLVQELSGYQNFDKTVEEYTSDGLGEIADNLSKKSEFSDIDSLVEINSDKDRKIIFTNLEISRSNQPSLKGRQAMIFGGNSQIILNFYTLNTDFNKYEKDFNKIVDSFSFDEGHAYTEKNPIFDRVLMKGFAGLVGGGIYGLFFLIYSKNKKDKNASNNYENRPKKKKISLNKKRRKTIFIGALILVLAYGFLNIFNNESSKEKTNPVNLTTAINEDKWKEYYLNNDKFKVNLPSEPNLSEKELSLKGNKIKFNEFISTAKNGVIYKISYGDLSSLKEIYESYDPSDSRCSIFNKTFYEDDISCLEKRQKDDVYSEIFKASKGSREMSKLSDDFNGYESFDYLWKNSELGIFIKGKVIASSTDVFLFSVENDAEEFPEFEKFIYSWKPFGKISE